MRSVQIYIEGQRLELFKDETITVKSTQQNISDISKVMTDFSRSFNIPATPKNNAIMQHFYNSSVDATIDYNIHRPASIEIDLIPFRTGKISLDNATMKEGKPESYTVTFFGDILSLKDKFGEDKLNELDELDVNNHTYNATNVKNRITNGSINYPVRYPLITRRDLTYNDGGSNDISTGQTNDAINFSELFPAIKLLSVFNAIQSRYGLTFSGTFFGDKRFSDAYLLCQNSNDFQFITGSEDVTLSSSGLSEGTSNDPLNTSQATDYFVDLFTNPRLNYTHQTMAQSFPTLTGTTGATPEMLIYIGHNVTLEVSNVSDVNETYYIDVFDNDSLYKTVEGTGNNTYTVVNDSGNNTGLSRNFTFKIRGTSAISLDLAITYQQKGLLSVFSTSNSTIELSNDYTHTSSITLSSSINVKDYMPKMKVSEFFRGVLSMFNLTCYGIGEDTYQIEPLNDWYLKGQTIDVTNYIDNKTVKIDRLPLYKRIEFSYQQSNSGNNTIFRDLFNRDYGNALNQFDYDGGDYKITLPFENLMFNRFENTNLQVGKTIDKDGNSYEPKPIIMYQYDSKLADFRFNNGSTIEDLTQYVPFGQDVNLNGTDYSLNFSPDDSTLLLQTSENNLYKTYYFDYLSNLYNLKNRLVKVKAILPVSIITTLKLNDRLVIRDTRYIINDMSTNLTTGEVSFTLMRDFRETIAESTGNINTDPITPSNESQCIDVRIIIPFACDSADISDPNGNITSISHSNITEETNVTVCIPENTTSEAFLLAENGDYLVTEDGVSLVTQEQQSGGGIAVYQIQVTYNFSNGNTTTNIINILQNP